jgi:hypothetical protein
MIRVEVDVESWLTANDLPYGVPHEDRASEEAQRVFDEARPIAVEVARRYVDIVRIRKRQSWLGDSSSVPKVVWHTDFYDSSGAILAVSFGYGPPAVVIRSSSETEHRAVLDSVAAAEDPSIGDAFLADAIFRNWPTGNPDRVQAVLLAAIACEVKIKQCLRELAGREQALLTVILENPRDVSLAALSLFDKALDAVCGRSLRRDNRELFNAVKTLFEDRNRIAHRGGEGLDTSELGRHIATAQAVFTYLEALP